MSDIELFRNLLGCTTDFFLSDIELADELDVSVRTIYRWKYEGKLPHKYMIPLLIKRLQVLMTDD
jgi:hypothetical protein